MQITEPVAAVSFSLSSVVAGMFALLIPAVGWLLARSIKSVDSKISELTGGISTLSGAVSEVRESNVELRVRIAHVETELVAMQQLYRDIAGFLSSQGFRRRKDSAGQE